MSVSGALSVGSLIAPGSSLVHVVSPQQLAFDQSASWTYLSSYGGRRCAVASGALVGTRRGSVLGGGAATSPLKFATSRAPPGPTASISKSSVDGRSPWGVSSSASSF